MNTFRSIIVLLSMGLLAACGESFEPSASNNTPQNTLATPTNLAVQNLNGNMVLSWQHNNAPGTTFEIEMKSNAISRWSPVRSDIQTTTYTMTPQDYSTNTNYQFKVKAIRDNQSSSFSQAINHISPAASSPLAPQELKLVEENKKISLSWQASNGATSYKVFEKIGNNDVRLLRPVGETHFSYDAIEDTLHEYYVTAVNSSGESGSSNSVFIDLNRTPLMMPTRFMVQLSNNDTAKLSWYYDQVANIEFIIEQSINNNQWIELTTQTQTSYDVTNLEEGSTYYFRVKAKLLNQFSQATAPASVTTQGTLAAPQAPSQLSYQQEGNNIELSWVDNADNETGFQIFQKLNTGEFSNQFQTGANVLSKVINLQAQAEYEFYVVAVNQTGPSLKSNTISVSTMMNLSNQAQFDVANCAGCHDGTSSANGESSLTDLDAKTRWQDKSYDEFEAKIDQMVNVFTNTCDETCTAQVKEYLWTDLWMLEKTNSVTPNIPTNLTAQLENNSQVTLNWQHQGQLGTQFTVQYKLRSNSSWTDIATQSAKMLVKDDLLSGQIYDFRVKAIYLDLESEYTAAVTVETIAIPTRPEAPENLTIQNNGKNITLNWNILSDNEDRFDVYAKKNQETAAIQHSVNTGQNTATFTVVDDAIYEFYVTASNEIGESNVSNSVFIDLNPTPVAPPANFSATLANINQANLTWTHNLNSGVTFKIQQNIDGAGWTTLVDNHNSKSYTAQNLAMGKTYTYKVQAKFDGNDSIFSQEQSVTPLTIPSAPTDLTIENDRFLITLSWQNNSINDDFKIMQSSNNNNFTEVPYSLSCDNTGSQYTCMFSATELSLYYFNVKSTNGAGDSLPSNTVSIDLSSETENKAAFTGTCDTCHKSNQASGLTQQRILDDQNAIDRWASYSFDTFTAKVNEMREKNYVSENNCNDACINKVIDYLWVETYQREKTATQISAPTGLTVSGTDTIAQLSWNHSQSVDQFIVEENINGSGWNALNPTTAKEISRDLMLSTTYQWRVKAVKGNSNSVYSSTATKTTPDVVVDRPEPPTNLVINNLNNQLTWTASTSGGYDEGVFYNVYQKTGNESYIKISGEQAFFTLHTITTALQPKNHKFYVATIQNGVESAPSNILDVSLDPNGPDQDNGQAFENAGCLGCHNGTQASIIASPQAKDSLVNNTFELFNAIVNEMAQTNGNNCDAVCAENIKDYLWVETYGLDRTSVAPRIPIDLDAVLTKNNAVITWTHQLPADLSYIVEEKRGSEDWAPLSRVSARSLSRDLAYETVYQWRVSAIRDELRSSPTQPITRETGSQAAPDAPTDLTATRIEKEITLTWADNSSDELRFNIYRKLNDGNYSSTPYATAQAGATTYVDNVSEDVKYTYYLTAENESAQSPASNEFSINLTPGQGTAWERGKGLYQAQCESCHVGGGSYGTFDQTSLLEKNIYSEEDLAAYIDRAMPASFNGSNPANCTGDCANDVAHYIMSWEVMPYKNGNDDNLVDNPIEVLACGNDDRFGYQNIRLLTQSQYQNTVIDLFDYTTDISANLPADNKEGSFTNNNAISLLDSAYVSYVGAAKIVAEHAITNFMSPLISCNALNDACITEFVDTGLEKIFRRPATQEEKAEYRAMADGTHTEGSTTEGFELALNAALSSPQFLYRSEIGEPTTVNGQPVFKLDSYEFATYLSYSFAGTTPDATLLTAAKNNQLETKQQIQAQVNRLLDTENAISMLEDLIHDWVKTKNLAGQSKADSLNVNFAQLAPLMKKELSLNFANAMLDPNETFQGLYNPGYTFINNTLANHYGLSGAPNNEFVKVTNNQRGGILLSGAYLSQYAQSDATNAITRAVHIRKDLMCQDIPPPPAGVDLDLNTKADALNEFLNADFTTKRMSFHRATEGGVCADCHAEVINPLGFGLEDYDAVGKFRSQDAQGNLINANGRFYSPYSQVQFFKDYDRDTTYVEFEGGKGLANLIATDNIVSDMARSCLSMQMMSFTSGIDAKSIANVQRDGVLQLAAGEQTAYQCEVQSLSDDLLTLSPRMMLQELATGQAVRYRKAWER